MRYTWRDNLEEWAYRNPGIVSLLWTLAVVAGILIGWGILTLFGPAVLGITIGFLFTWGFIYVAMNV